MCYKIIKSNVYFNNLRSRPFNHLLHTTLQNKFFACSTSNILSKKHYNVFRQKLYSTTLKWNIYKKLLCSITMIQMRTFITETERNLHHPLFPYPLQGRAHKLIYVACIVNTCMQCTNAHTCVNYKKSQHCGHNFTQVRC